MLRRSCSSFPVAAPMSLVTVHPATPEHNSRLFTGEQNVRNKFLVNWKQKNLTPKTFLSKILFRHSTYSYINYSSRTLKVLFIFKRASYEQEVWGGETLRVYFEECISRILVWFYILSFQWLSMYTRKHWKIFVALFESRHVGRFVCSIEHRCCFTIVDKT